MALCTPERRRMCYNIVIALFCIVLVVFMYLSSSAELDLNHQNTTATDTGAASPFGVAKIIHSMLYQQVIHSPLQVVNALLALFIGGVMLMDGLHTYQLILILVLFVSSYFIAMGELQLVYSHLGVQLWMKFVSLQTACFLSWIAWKNFHAMKDLFGLIVGWCLFVQSERFFVNYGKERSLSWVEATAKNDVFVMFWGTVCLASCYRLFGEGPSYLWAILAPLVGSVFVSASLWYFVALAAKMNEGKLKEMPIWLAFVNTMSPWGTDSVGVFEDVNGVSMNRVASLLLAFVIFLLCARNQVLRAKEEKSRGIDAQGSEAVQGLASPLLGGASVPELMYVSSPNSFQHNLSGCYIRSRNGDANDQPVWRHKSGGYWLFCGKNKKWYIGGPDVQHKQFSESTSCWIESSCEDENGSPAFVRSWKRHCVITKLFVSDPEIFVSDQDFASKEPMGP